ncbi:Protein transport protein-like [Capsicum annuum]|uniref:Protein transport protein-like n=1 Tax=Capsicum annuum TaxID=4072 RepID=A0A2G3A4N6_CAPAN|nr:Protein transport protein-like [Capsicum annuum]
MMVVGTLTLAKYTGGQVYYYPNFQAAVHKDKLCHELARHLTRMIAWESVIRVRCGKGYLAIVLRLLDSQVQDVLSLYLGVRFTTYHGNFMLRSTKLIALPAVDCDKAYTMHFSLEETLLTSQTVYFQVVLLYPFNIIAAHNKVSYSISLSWFLETILNKFKRYTPSLRERHNSVHTAASPVVADLGEMYRLADIGANVSLFTRLAIEKTLTSKLEEARNSVQLRIVKALREYRNLPAVQHRLGGRMIYPESLKCLPLYGLALCKSIAICGGYADAQPDERCAAGYTMMALPDKNLLKLRYRHLICIDEYLLKKTSLAEDSEDTWKGLPLASGSLDPQGLYLYDDGFQFVLWFGSMLSPDRVKNFLGENFVADYIKTNFKLSVNYDYLSLSMLNLEKILRIQDTANKRKNRSFKYCIMWSTHPNFLQLVPNIWDTPITGYRMYQVVRKLKLLKQHLKKLHKQNFSNVVDDADMAREDMNRVQSLLHQDPSCVALHSED